MQIHVAKNGQQTGPFDEALVREKLAQGEFAPTDLAWHADLAGWQPLSTLFPLAAPPPPPPVAAASPVFPPDPSPASPAAYVPPASAPGLSPYGGPPASGGPYAPLPVAGGPGQLAPPQFYNPAAFGDPNLASLGQRFLGILIDTVVSSLLTLPGFVMLVAANSNSGRGGFSYSASGLGLLLLILGSLAGYALQGYLLATSGQSVGKKVVGTRVVLLNGQPAGVVPAFVLRMLIPGILLGALPQVPLIGPLLGCVGAIYAITDICFVFRNDHRCVHDLFSGTKVVRA